MVAGQPVSTTLEQEEKRYERSSGEYDTLRLLVENENGIPLGFISICGIDKQNKKVELGILIGEKKYWGQGYGTDALCTITDYLFNKLGFNRISVEVFAYNDRAKALYEKVGFQVEGTQRDGLSRNGTFADIIYMGLLKKDYMQKQKAIKLFNLKKTLV